MTETPLPHLVSLPALLSHPQDTSENRDLPILCRPTVFKTGKLRREEYYSLALRVGYILYQMIPRSPLRGSLSLHRLITLQIIWGDWRQTKPPLIQLKLIVDANLFQKKISIK